MKTNETVSENLLRLEYEVEGVTTKTLMFGVCYLPPSAVRRHTRNGIPLVQAIQTGRTPSFCKNEPLFATRAEAQTRVDARNSAEYSGEKYFHVIERWAVPVTEHKPFVPTCRDDLMGKERTCYDVAVDEAYRDFTGDDLDAELASIDREYFDR